MHLSETSTEALAAELRKRPDILDKNGIMPYEVYRLMARLQPIPCVDGIAVRRNSTGQVEAMAIRRGTGAEKGKLCSIGGRILRNESIEECLRRQFRNDVGCKVEPLVPWQHPVVVLQCAPQDEVAGKPEFGPEYGKHTTSLYYPVRLLGEPQFGSTMHGGQEALSVEWYSRETLPSREQFGFDQQPKFIACIDAAEKLLPH